MDLKTHRNTLLLVRQIFDRKASTVPCIETIPQKPSCPSMAPVLQPFPRTSPEEQGISSAYLARFIDELNRDETLDPHGIMILRNGAVIAEGAFGSYDQSLWHMIFSGSKSITALAVGMLIDEGKLSLDDKIVKIFENDINMITLLTHKDMTVRHLLTMTSGIVFNEAGAVTETDWVKCFLESAVRNEPGKKFEYNSMNSYMLSAIVRKVSGRGLMSYLKERLWDPLGIRDVFWETCPGGIEKGGWGLYIRPEDIAKIGQLVLQQGLWNGRRLVSSAWIKEACSFQTETPKRLGGFNYGYHVWVGREQNVFLFNGMFGQNLLGFPDTGILLVSNAGNNELFQQGNFFSLVEKYFPADYRPANSLPEDPEAYGRLKVLTDSLRRSFPVRPSPERPLYIKSEKLTSLPDLCASLAGRTYIADEQQAPAVGLLPLIIQTVQNNYTKGLKSLAFSFEDGIFTLTVTETDAVYRLPIGFGAPETADLDFHGEPYKTGITGTFTTDEDDRLVLKLRVSFLETPNSRILKIFFYDGWIITKWLESPGKNYLGEALASIAHEVKLGPLLNTIMGKADTDFIEHKIGGAFEPEVICRLAGAK